MPINLKNLERFIEIVFKLESIYYILIGLTFLNLIFLIIWPRNDRSNLLRLAFGFSFIIFLCSLFFFCYFIPNPDSLPFPYLQIDLKMYFIFPLSIYIDSVSASFILLTSFIFPFCILYSWYIIKYKLKEYLILLVIIELLLFFVFSIIDLFFFYIAFESVLIPMFFLIGIWGSRRRKIHAVYQFFLLTAFGSFIMLIAIIYIYIQLGSTDLRIIEVANFSWTEQKLLWCAFFFAFAIKVPIFPFHIWLPEAHVEAPTVGSVILAGVLLKMGTYGMYRFLLVPFAAASSFFSPFVYTLCIVGLFYTSLTTIRQVDLKKIIAYASVGHMSYVILGLFSFNLYGISGSIFLMLGHGLVSSALFF